MAPSTTPIQTTTQKQSSDIDQLIQDALAAYWHSQFHESIIDAPERMRAVLEVVAQYLETTATNG